MEKELGNITHFCEGFVSSLRKEWHAVFKVVDLQKLPKEEFVTKTKVEFSVFAWVKNLFL